MNTKKLFVTFFIILSILGTSLGSHGSHHLKSKKKSKRGSKIMPLSHIGLTSLSKIKIKYLENFYPKREKSVPLPEFINPYTLGRREFVHVMEVLNKKHQLTETYDKQGVPLFKLKADHVIKPLNNFLQKSIQKAVALGF